MKQKLFAVLSMLALLVGLLCVPAAAEETENFVYDIAGILSSDDILSLNDAARKVSQAHNCGVYVAVFDDMGEYGFSNIESFAEEVYTQWELGFGAERNGIVLVMSMAERDYDLCAYGDAAHTAFTDYGKDVLADEFIDDFRYNDWAGGFRDYISECDYMLSRAESGNPVDVSYSSRTSPQRSLPERIGTALGPGLIVGILVGFIYAGALKRKMKTARVAREASEYIGRRGIQMQAENDMFTHTTVTRQRIERDNDSRGGHGGTSVNSGGFSHSSGKF